MNRSTAHQQEQRLNCLSCRRRKSKCDREEPCSSCVLRGTEQYCYTIDHLPPKSNKTEDDSVRHNLQGTLATDQAGPSKVRKLTGEQTSNHDKSPLHVTLQEATSNIRGALQNFENVLSMSKVESGKQLQVTGEEWMSWEDFSSILPSINDCEKIFHCFFNELAWSVSCVDRKSFETMWQTACKERGSVLRHRAALICSMIAYVALLAPKSHPASQLTGKHSTDHSWQIENARILLETFYDQTEDNYIDGSQYRLEDIEGLKKEDEFERILRQLEAETLYCYYNASADIRKRSFYTISRAIRLGKTISFFDEERWRGKKEDDNWRRGIAWDLIIVDRWLSLFPPYIVDLSKPLNLRKPWDRSSEYLTYRDVHSDKIVRVVDYLRMAPSTTMAERVKYAQSIEQDLQDFKVSLPKQWQYDWSTQNLRSNDPNSFRLATQALSYHSANEFLLCLITRPFLMNDGAPANLQFAALDHARKIIEAMPNLVTLANSPWVSSSTFNWSSGHLFTAATIFAAVFLSDHGKEDMTWPASDLDWFSSVLFDVVDSLHLVFQGSKSYTARVCKDLLVALCNSREILKERFQKREKASTVAPITTVSSSPSAAAINPNNSSFTSKPGLDPILERILLPSLTETAQPSTNSNDVFFDELLFDPWEWARLTAGLDMTSTV